MKIYTVRIHYPKVTEEQIPASDFGIIEKLYSIFGIKIELVREEEYVMPMKVIKKNKRIKKNVERTGKNI